METHSFGVQVADQGGLYPFLKRVFDQRGNKLDLIKLKEDRI